MSEASALRYEFSADDGFVLRFRGFELGHAQGVALLEETDGGFEIAVIYLGAPGAGMRITCTMDDAGWRETAHDLAAQLEASEYVIDFWEDNNGGRGSLATLGYQARAAA